MANTAALPNAFTPLAFLPPALADQVELARYLYAATLGAYIWDIVLNSGSDYKLLFKHRIRFPTIAYFLSRIFTLGYILMCFIDKVAAVQDCNAMQLAIGIILLLAQAATSMLFLLRAIAVWYPNKIAATVFILLWLGVIGACTVVPVGSHAAHIGPTSQCLNTVVSDRTDLVVIMGVINDSAIFFAINYRILAHMIVANSFKARIAVFFGGGELSRLSRALLESGQHFYLVAVCASIVGLVFLKLPNVPTIYHAMLSVPGLGLINIMACLVFRRIKFGTITSNGTTRATTTGGSNFHATVNPRSSLPLHHPRSVDPTATSGFESNIAFPLDVLVQKETRRFGDGSTDDIERQENPKTAALA